MTGLDSVARTLGQVGATLSIGGRTLLSLDTNPVPAEWAHITKVDPEGDKKLPLSYPLFLDHTSAVSVGGSRDVTDRNTEETFDLITAAGVPAFHEPSAADHVTEQTLEQAEFTAVPEVLNGDSQALVGTLGEGIEYVREEMAPAIIEEKLPLPVSEGVADRLANFAASWFLTDLAVFEAYIIQNPDSAAAREAAVTASDLLTPREAKQRAMAAERHLDSEVLYLEYSGTFGGEEAVDILTAVDDGVDWTRIWYGGGLDSRANAETVLEAGADAIVVGDVFHDIATEEAALLDAAIEALPVDATRRDVESWVETQVEPSETSAAKYLSTNTGVPTPETAAVRYLAAGVRFGLALHAIAAELSDPSAGDLRDALSGESVPGEAAFDRVMADGARPLARSLGLSLLADRFDVDLDGVESRHLAVDV